MLQDAVAYLLRRPKIAQDMGYKAQHNAQEIFTLEKTASGYEEIYYKLVPNQR
jgi:hypothetical protein